MNPAQTVMAKMINRLTTKAESKAKWPVLVCLCLMLIGGLPLSALAANDDSQPPEVSTNLVAPVVLPIEIMGDAGTTETVTVNVPNASGVTGLWMQVHNLSYDNKGSVKVNGGNWIDLSNNSVAVAYPENQIFGIGGGYSTIRITVPLSSGAAVNGTNTIQFRFNGTDNLSMGWRVLQFNFVKSDGTKVIPESEFVEDNPANWTPIRTSTSDLQAGEDLWYNAALTEPGTGSIQARCTDCHATDARDLKYFNYSNKSIVERAKFHGLSQTQGEQIASWIRSLDYPAPGRPWNPPYQPGPGLDDKPVEEWAAGAGLEWVLDDDADTWQYIFPNGVSDQVASTKSTLNMRELPLALQFPDWNRWLPRIHPIDAWGNSFENSEAWQAYQEMIAEPNGVNQADWQLVQVVSEFDSDVSDWRRNANSPGSAQDHADANLGLQSWQITKVWGLMQEYHLEDHGKELYPGGEERTWFSHARNIFNVAPHISSAPGAHTHGTEALDKFFSHAWYMYQLVINPGNRDPREHRPVDWKYQFGHIGDFSKHTGLQSGNRLVATYIKMIQMLDNDDGINSDGWYMRHAHPYWFVRSMATAPGQTNMGIWGSVPVDQHSKVAEVMIRSFLKKSMEYSTSEWPRGEQHWEMEPANYKPQFSNDNGDIFEDRFNYADNFYRIVPEFLDRGVAPSLMDSLANWGESLWPLGDWEDLVDYTDTGGGGGGDLPVVSVSTDANNNEAQEPGGSGNKGKFVISRSGSTSQALSVNFSLTGTALNGTDYEDINGPIVLGAGESEVAVHVDPIDDNKNESDESVILTLQSNSAYTIESGQNSAIVTIKDDDGGEAYANGDTTGDGSVSALDAALVLQHVAAILPLEGAAFTAGDVSGDQNVSAFDASLILQYITGIIDCFPSDAGCPAGKVSARNSP